MVGTRLKDKICVVTGAAQGIGRATAELFVKEGGVVYFTDEAIHAGSPDGCASQAMTI